VVAKPTHAVAIAIAVVNVVVNATVASAHLQRLRPWLRLLAVATNPSRVKASERT
jgi:hypothetical protein